MKASSAAVQGALAVAGLLAAYFTWQRPAEDKDAVATVIDVTKPQLERIRYEDPKRVVELVTGRDGTWVRQTERPPEPAVPAPSESRPREYKANDSADRVVDSFTPLRALRSLGKLPDDKLAELGLAKSERRLEVAARGATWRLRLASANANEANAPPAPYALNEEDGRVYLLRGTLLSDLEFAASRLVDRRLHAFRDDEWDSVRIRTGAQERRLTKSGDKLVAPNGAADEFASNWHGRLWKEVAVDVLGRGEKPAAGEPEVQVRVDYLRGDREVGFIELGRAGDDVFARTEHTAGWARLQGGADVLLREREQVVAGN